MKEAARPRQVRRARPEVSAVLRAALIGVILGAVPTAPAAAPRKGKVLPGIVVEFNAPDGWPLNAKYVPAKDGKLTLILLHGTGQRKDDWHALGRSLAGWGFGYLALDLRGHGESGKGPDGQPASWRKFKPTKEANEFANMTRDIEGAAAYLVGQGVLEDAIGIIGADVGSSVGIKYAAVHPKVPLIAMLSPGTHYQEVLTINAMRAYKNRPILMVYSLADRNSSRATPVLESFARQSAGDLNVTVIKVAQEHGTKMLRGDLPRQIIDWLLSPVRVPGETEVSTETAHPPAPEPYPDAADTLTEPDPVAP